MISGNTDVYIGDCGCQEQQLQIGLAEVIIHIEPDGNGEALIDMGDWQTEKHFQCDSIDHLRRRVTEYIESLPQEA